MLFLITCFIIAVLILYIVSICNGGIDVIEGLDTFNGRMAIDEQYFYDKLFDNVDYYPNEYENDYNLNDVIITGFDRCKEKCKGRCVEYGVTSIAYCFKDE